MNEELQDSGVSEQVEQEALPSDEEIVTQRLLEAGAVESTGQLSDNMNVLKVKKMFNGDEDLFKDFLKLLNSINKIYEENPLLFTRAADVRKWAEIINNSKHI